MNWRAVITVTAGVLVVAAIVAALPFKGRPVVETRISKEGQP